MYLTVERGLQIQRDQLTVMKQNMTPAQAAELQRQVDNLNKDRDKWKDGFDVPRGVTTERLAWLIRGKTEEEYRAYLNSMD